MSSSDIMVRSIYVGDIKTRLLSNSPMLSFSRTHPYSLLSGCEGELDRANECCCHVNVCQSLSHSTWRRCSVHSSSVVTYVVCRSPQPKSHSCILKRRAATVRNPDYI